MFRVEKSGSEEEPEGEDLNSDIEEEDEDVGSTY